MLVSDALMAAVVVPAVVVPAVVVPAVVVPAVVVPECALGKWRPEGRPVYEPGIAVVTTYISKSE